MTTHHMRLHPEPFRLIESGEKRVECRVNDEKRQQLQVGDTLVLTLRESDPSETLTLTRIIIGLHPFPSFEAMFERFPEERGDGQWPAKYYRPEAIATHGVVAIELGE